MITLYKELKQVGMVKRFYTFYGVSLLTGIALIYILFMLGNYLQWFSFVILLRAILQPYFHFKMRLPLYKAKKEIKAEEAECPNMLKGYYYFILFSWKQDFLKLRIFYFSQLGMIAFCLISAYSLCNVEPFFLRIGMIVFLNINVAFLTIIEAVKYKSICKECDEGDSCREWLEW